MTEAEWLASSDPPTMFSLLIDGTSAVTRAMWRPSDRKLRLFACACWGHDREWNVSEEMPVDAEAISALRECEPSKAAALLRDIFGNPFWPVHRAEFTRPACAYCGHPVLLGVASDEWACKACLKRQPWPQTEWDRWLIWHDSLIPKMAQAIYDDRAFDRMPILADALEEAGCQNEDILMHCRGLEHCHHHPTCNDISKYRGEWVTSGGMRGPKGPIPCDECHDTKLVPLRGPHVRGCWCLDLLLGKK